MEGRQSHARNSKQLRAHPKRTLSVLYKGPDNTILYTLPRMPEMKLLEEFITPFPGRRDSICVLKKANRNLWILERYVN